VEWQGRLAIPLEERWRRYKEARERIFKDHQLEGMTAVTRRIHKARQRFKKRKMERQEVQRTISQIESLKYTNDDPYATVTIADQEIQGLLDSGASISVLGTGCQELVDRLGLDWLPYRGNVKTANGEDQRILGKVIVRVVFWGREASMCLYLCPALKRQLYLGVDFWKEFNIASELFGGGVEELVESQEDTTVEPERHQLSAS